MKFFFNFAYKNMFRKKGRTMLTTIPIIAGTVLLVYTISFIEGMNNMSYNNIINYQTAHAKIFHRDYDFDKKGANDNATFNADENLTKYIESNKLVNSITQQIMFSGNLSDGINKIPVLALGVMPLSYRKTFSTLENNTPIEMPGNGDIYIGADLIKLFDLEEGEICFLEGRTKHGAYDAVDLTCIGFIRTGNPNIDNSSVIVNINTAKRFLETDGEITDIAILLKSRKSTDSFVRQMRVFLNEYYPELRIMSWKEEEEDFFAFAYADQISGYISILMVLIIAGVGIANTMLLSTYERLKEIGTMRALGASSRVIMQLFITEGALIGVLGALIGSGLGIIMMWHASYVGIDISAMIGNMEWGYPINTVVRGAFNLMIVVKTVIFTFLMAMVSSLYPARRAIKEQIVKIMR